MEINLKMGQETVEIALKVNRNSQRVMYRNTKNKNVNKKKN